MNYLDLNTIREFGGINFIAKQLVEGFITGQHSSPFHGFSVEFSEHRHYNSGESTRHLDWKVYAKTDKLFVKRYEEETNLRCYLLLDCSGSMYYPRPKGEKLIYSALCAASIATMLQKQRDTFSLTLFSDEVEFSSPMKSSGGHLHMILEQLENVLSSTKAHQPKKSLSKENIVDRLHFLAETAHKRSLIIIFSDMFTNDTSQHSLFEALRHLQYNKHEVLVFHITDPKTERDLEFSNRPYEFIDLESHTSVKMNPKEAVFEYKKYMNEYYNELKLRCQQFKIDFVEVNIQEDFKVVFNAFLAKRTKK